MRIKNISKGTIYLTDLRDEHIAIPKGETVNLLDYTTMDKIRQSQTLAYAKEHKLIKMLDILLEAPVKKTEAERPTMDVEPILNKLTEMTEYLKNNPGSLQAQVQSAKTEDQFVEEVDEEAISKVHQMSIKRITKDIEGQVKSTKGQSDSDASKNANELKDLI